MKTNSTPQASPSTSLQIVVKDLKPFKRNTLEGFVLLSLPQVGLELHECTFHRDANGNAWVGLPARSYQAQGQKKWMRLVDTTDKDAHYRLQRAAVRAVDEFLARQQTTTTPAPLPPKAAIPRDSEW